MPCLWGSSITKAYRLVWASCLCLFPYCWLSIFILWKSNDQNNSLLLCLNHSHSVPHLAMLPLNGTKRRLILPVFDLNHNLSWIINHFIFPHQQISRGVSILHWSMYKFIYLVFGFFAGTFVKALILAFLANQSSLLYFANGLLSFFTIAIMVLLGSLTLEHK